jgi:hypothetical protein
MKHVWMLQERYAGSETEILGFFEDFPTVEQLIEVIVGIRDPEILIEEIYAKLKTHSVCSYSVLDRIWFIKKYPVNSVL